MFSFDLPKSQELSSYPSDFDSFVRPTSSPQEMGVTQVSQGLKRKHEEEALPLNTWDIKRAKETGLEFQDLPSEIIERIVSYLPKRDVAIFEQTAKTHSQHTGFFWSQEVKREGFGVFSSIDPTLDGKSQYLFTRAIFKFLCMIEDRPFDQRKAKHLKAEFKWVKTDFPKLHDLFLYMIYEREALRISHKTGNPAEDIPAKTVVQYRTGPNIYERVTEEIRRDIYENVGTDEGASILQFFMDLKHLKGSLAFSRVQDLNSPIADLLTTTHSYASNAIPLHAAKNNDFRALDKLFERSPFNILDLIRKLDRKGKYYPPVLVQLAIEAQDEDRFDDANAHFAEALDGYGSNVPFDYFILLANFKLQCGKPEEAEAALNKAMESFTPKFKYELLGLLYDVKSALNKWVEAEKIASEMVQNWGNENDLPLLARAKARLEKFEEANPVYAEILNDLNQQERKNQAIKAYVFAEAAFVEMRLGQNVIADELFSRAINLQREFPDGNPWGNKLPAAVLADVASNKMHLEKWPESHSFFYQALQCYQEENTTVPPVVLINLANVSLRLKRYQEAYNHLSKAIETLGGKSKASRDILEMMKEIEGLLEEEGD